MNPIHSKQIAEFLGNCSKLDSKSLSRFTVKEREILHLMVKAHLDPDKYLDQVTEKKFEKVASRYNKIQINPSSQDKKITIVMRNAFGISSKKLYAEINGNFRSFKTKQDVLDYIDQVGAKNVTSLNLNEVVSGDLFYSDLFYDFPKLPNLKWLSTHVEELPMGNIAKRFPSLEVLIAPKVKDVFISLAYKLESLKKVEAENAEIIKIYTKGVKEIIAPNAEGINCENNKVKRINAPNAKKVTVHNCRFLKNIDAPKAKVVTSTLCPALKKKNIKVGEGGVIEHFSG